ncbi:MAG: hypothetical protein KJ645_13925 [Planctomycetes bacterium]|nr:hypothetical protein [Planctomycetota bacterium]
MFKFWRYILKNTGRNPVRTSLTVLGVGLAAFIVIYLVAVFDSRNQLVARSADTLLVVNEKDVY